MTYVPTRQHAEPHFHHFAKMTLATMVTKHTLFVAKMISPKVSALKDVMFVDKSQDDALGSHPKGRNPAK